MIFAAKVWESTDKCTKKRVVKWTECREYQQFQPRKRKFSNGKEATAEISLNKQKELKELRMELECIPIGMPSQKQQNMKKKAVSANQMDKQRVRSELRRTMF